MREREDINVRSTRIRTRDEQRTIIPNGQVYTSAIVVRTAYPSRRLDVSVKVGFDEDIATVRRTIEQTVAAIDGVKAEPASYVVVTELASASVALTAYFFVRSSASAVLMSDRVLTRLKAALDESGIAVS